MTTGERLAALAGASGTAASLLALIGSGATTGAALVDYSGLSSDTAINHLLVDAIQQGGAAGYDTKKRRKNIVNLNGVLYQFDTEREAIAFIAASESDNTETVNAEITKETPEPIKAVSIKQVESLVESASIPLTRMDIYNYIQFADYAAIMQAYDNWLSNDEEEALLLLM